MDRFEKMALRNELVNRGITISKAAELTGIETELLRQSFEGSREITAKELIAIISVTGIPLEKLINKEPEITGAEIIDWNEKEIMSKEYAIAMLDETMCFIRKLYYFPKAKPFSGEADYVGRMQELNGLKELIIKLFEG